ncbi:MAG: aminotransferase class III-fold pyridoxal phosphate-dependent enzyme, partial [Pseudomonadota bacterium]
MPHLMNTYGRLPVAFSHGVACRLFDEQGKSYLDALAGIAVNTLGHAHPHFSRVLAEQIPRLIHVSNLYHIREAERLSDRLSALANMDEVFFCNSGCEANEAAIKLARLYGHQQGIDQPAIIVMEHAFHACSMTMMAGWS